MDEDLGRRLADGGRAHGTRATPTGLVDRFGADPIFVKPYETPTPSVSCRAVTRSDIDPSVFADRVSRFRATELV